MRLQAVHAIYKDGYLVFADPALAPKGLTEVLVTYLEESPTETLGSIDPIQALRGRGKGEPLVEKLLQTRREDCERDERKSRALRP
jgi:hypothetical protein